MGVEGVDGGPLVASGAGFTVQAGEVGAVCVVRALVFPVALVAVTGLEFLLRPGGGGGVGRVPSTELGFECATASGVDPVAGVGLVGG